MSRNQRAFVAFLAVIIVAIGVNLLAPPVLPDWLWWTVGIIVTILMLVAMLLWIEQPWRNTQSFRDRQRLREANWRAGDRRR